MVGKGGGISHNDWRILYECYVESRLKVNGGTKGYRERLLRALSPYIIPAKCEIISREMRLTHAHSS